jgi:hypothetical protein
MTVKLWLGQLCLGTLETAQLPRIFDNIALALIDRQGTRVTQSQLAILRMAQCEPDTPAIPRDPQHHALVAQGAKHILGEEKSSGGQLGRPSGARFRT